MAKYRKKPVVIEAFQMTKERRWDNSEWPNWLNMAWQREIGEEGAMWCVDGGEELFCGTLEGQHAITFGDFIIQGVKGEIYPCKPDIFESTYERVDDPKYFSERHLQQPVIDRGVGD
jgi:hypothetical protein